MFDDPWSLNGVYSFIKYVNYYSKMQKKYLRALAEKISTASPKIAQTAYARFYNYEDLM